jgi:hypothetical protein
MSGAKVTDGWPPPGHHSWYAIEEHIDGHNLFRYDMSIPSKFPNIDISTVRVGRHGGPGAADSAFRQELFLRLGAVTAAGGHAETAMKRLILLLTGDSASFSLVDKTWSDLDKILRAECTGADETREHLKEILDWGEDVRIKARRDDVVHAYWWLFDGCEARRSRFYRKTDGTIITASLTDLDEDAEMIFEFAAKLDDLLGSDWPLAMLPKAD